MLTDFHSVDEAFKRLRPFPGLWDEDSFHLGCIPKIFSWKLLGPACSYLKLVYDMLQFISDSDDSLAKAFDKFTMTFLENRCPKWSIRDQQAISKSSEIFSSVTDPRQRARLVKNALTADGVILTLRTFFRDKRFIESIALLKRILPRKSKKGHRRSLRSIALQCFEPTSGDQYLEVGEGQYTRVHLPPGEQFANAFLQLCAHGIRACLLKESVAQSMKNASIKGLAKLARNLGFKSASIEAETNRIELSHFKSPENYEASVAPLDADVDYQVALLHRTQSTSEAPQFSSDVQQTILQCDPRHVFLPQLQQDPSGGPGKYASAFCLLYYTFLAFFRDEMDVRVQPSSPALLQLVDAWRSNSFSSEYSRVDEVTSPSLSSAEEDSSRSHSSVEGDSSLGHTYREELRQLEYRTFDAQSSSMYSDSVPASPDPIDLYMVVKNVTRQYMRAEGRVVFIKFPEVVIKVTRLEWDAIREIVERIENGTFARQNVSRRQMYGVVYRDRLLALDISTLKDRQANNSRLDDSDFRHVIFVVDQDSLAVEHFFSGRSFRECCENWKAPKRSSEEFEDGRARKRQRLN